MMWNSFLKVKNNSKRLFDLNKRRKGYLVKVSSSQLCRKKKSQRSKVMSNLGNLNRIRPFSKIKMVKNKHL